MSTPSVLSKRWGGRLGRLGQHATGGWSAGDFLSRERIKKPRCTCRRGPKEHLHHILTPGSTTANLRPRSAASALAPRSLSLCPRSAGASGTGHSSFGTLSIPRASYTSSGRACLEAAFPLSALPPHQPHPESGLLFRGLPLHGLLSLPGKPAIGGAEAFIAQGAASAGLQPLVDPLVLPSVI